jgi:multimeric flavodoxin WrbA
MKTIIINGSPKGKNGNTEIFIQNFISCMDHKPEVRRIAEEDYEELSNLTQKYDSIILAMPFYIHSMPGIAMRFIEHLKANTGNAHKSIGFILQCGFPEASQCDYLIRYFNCLSEELNMDYLGTFIKGDSAGTYMMPKYMTRKLFNNLKNLGRIYEETGKFDTTIIQKMMQPYEVKGFKLKFMRFAKRIGLMDIMWNKFLKENKAFEERFARPF